MALPVILVNNSGGSDTLSSGAGPGTALNGVKAGTDGVNGKTVTISDALVDLSGVAVDGSAAIFINDSTAGHRNFDNITAISGSVGSWAVTVQNGFSLSLSNQSWAIGGTRASIGSSTSGRLLENNSGNGDAMPGWVIEMQSGHSETIAAAINTRRVGDFTNGRIILRGTSGAGTMPILNFSNNGDAFVPRVSYWTYRDFEMRNTFGGTHNASQAFNIQGVNDLYIKNIRANNSTNNFWRGINIGGAQTDLTIEDSRFEHCADSGISMGSSAGTGIFKVRNCSLSFNTQHGFIHQGTGATYDIRGNLFAFNTLDGIHVNDSTGLIEMIIAQNVFNGNGSDGIEIATTAAHISGSNLVGITAENNRFTLNGAYGINFSGTGTINDLLLNTALFNIRNNNFFGNTTNKYFPTTLTVSIAEDTTDPSGGLASATKDYAGTTNGLNFMSAVNKGFGYPKGGTIAVGNNTASNNYTDIGLQHQDTGSGSSVGGFFIQ